MTTHPSHKTILEKENPVNKFLRKRLIPVLTMLMLGHAASLLAADTRVEKPAFNTGKVTLTFAEAPLKTMTEVPFSIEILGDTGTVISDAKLSIALDMPAMPMPPNNPKAIWQEGAYRGKAIFTMAGAWQVTINIQRPGYDQEQVVFDLHEVMMK